MEIEIVKKNEVVNNSLIYTALNVATSKYILTENIHSEPLSIAVFVSGQVVYEFIKYKNIIKNQDYYFPVLWSVFWNSMFMEKKESIIFDVFITTGAIFTGKHL